MEKKKNPFNGWIQKRRTRPGYWKAALKTRIADEIDRLTVASKMSRADLAREAGCSKPYITQVLRGGKNLTIDTMVNFACVFGLVPRIEFVEPAAFWSPMYFFTLDVRGQAFGSIGKVQVDFEERVRPSALPDSEECSENGSAEFEWSVEEQVA
jgi:transcriptional regulator with XRE-family HTH domain